MVLALRPCSDLRTMIRFVRFTLRTWLIPTNDFLPTTWTVVTSFFIRFEEVGLAERKRVLPLLLAFAVYTGFVYSGVYKTK